MAKAKATPVKKEEQLITLTKEQFQKLLEVRELLDTASDALDNIDGDTNLFEIGKQVGSACSDIITAFNELSEVVLDKTLDSYDDEDSDDEKSDWTFA